MKQFKSMLSLAIVVATLGIGNAFALTATSNMGVSADVSADCTIGASPLAFSAYNPISTNNPSGVDATTTANLTVVCTEGSTATITLGQGLTPDGASTDDTPLRQMAHGSDLLAYNLYQDVAHTIVWGNSSETGVGYEGAGTPTNVTVFGLAPRGQTVPSGSYTDTVVATITF